MSKLEDPRDLDMVQIVIAGGLGQSNSAMLENTPYIVYFSPPVF